MPRLIFAACLLLLASGCEPAQSAAQAQAPDHRVQRPSRSVRLGHTVTAHWSDHETGTSPQIDIPIRDSRQGETVGLPGSSWRCLAWVVGPGTWVMCTHASGVSVETYAWDNPATEGRPRRCHGASMIVTGTRNVPPRNLPRQFSIRLLCAE